MYKKATVLKLRFKTAVGMITTEQLWDLSIPQLDSLALILEEEWKKSGKKFFVVKRTKKDKIAKLRFDIVLDILQTKVDEEAQLLEASEIKAHNTKILELISNKQDEELKGRSLKELQRMLK